MKAVFIETGNAKDDPFAQCWYTPDKSRFAVPLLALPNLAGVSPSDWEINILDEKVHPINFDIDCELVCMSFKSKDANRTYRYAEAFRQRGKTVILGGVHASLLPEEAALYADAVVVGEAEGIWGQVIEDLRKGSLQEIYYAPKGIRLDAAPLPRFDLIDNDRYCCHAVQTSRGCLVGCDFCPIQKMYGGKSRNKAIDRVMQEVDRVLAIDPDKNVFFVDEMFCGGNKQYQGELLAELRKNKVDFVCISDFKVIDPAYIGDLARSGCKTISINMPGTCLPQELRAVKAIQRLGIDVWGFFMFGFSFHNPDVFRRVVDFVEESGMRNLTLTVATPFPNTPMARVAEERGAITSTNWDLYDQCHVTMEPERLSALDLEEGFHWAWQQLEERLYIDDNVFRRKETIRRKCKRAVGMLTLGAERAYRNFRGLHDKPVQLEEIIGVKRAEVSITTHNTMGV